MVSDKCILTVSCALVLFSLFIAVPGHPCGPLVQPVGGFIDFLGTVAADFFCKEGYEVRGVARLFCLHKPNSQMWSGPEPNCTRTLLPVCVCVCVCVCPYGSVVYVVNRNTTGAMPP